MNANAESIFNQIEDKKAKKQRFERRLVKELFTQGFATYVKTNGEQSELGFSDVLDESQCSLDNVIRDLCVSSRTNDIGFIDSAIRLTRILEQHAHVCAEKIAEMVNVDDQEEIGRKVRFPRQAKSTRQRNLP